MTEDKATVYHRLRRRAEIGGTVAAAVALIMLVASGGAVRLREVASNTGQVTPGFEESVTVAVAALLFFGLLALIELPFAFYQGYTLEHRYELSNQTARQWAADQAKGAALGAIFTSLGASIVYALVSWNRDWWWLAAAAVVKPYAVAFLPYLWITGRTRTALTCAAGLAMALVAPAIVYGRATPALLRELSRERVPRETVVDALGAVRDARAQMALLSLLEDPSPAVRVSVLQAVGPILDGRAADALARLLGDPDPEVVALAAGHLGRLSAREFDGAVDGADAVHEDVLHGPVVWQVVHRQVEGLAQRPQLELQA